MHFELYQRSATTARPSRPIWLNVDPRPLSDYADAAAENVRVGGALIPRARLAKGISAYTMAIDWYLGDRMVKRLETLDGGVARTGSGVDFVTNMLSIAADRATSRNRLPTPSPSPESNASWLDLS